MQKFEEKIIPEIIQEIYNGITIGHLKSERSDKVNRCSAANLCPRRRVFSRLKTPCKALAPRTITNFLQGNLGEATMKAMVKTYLVGENKYYKNVDFGEVLGSVLIDNYLIEQTAQPEISFEVESFPGEMITITGHPDGVGTKLDGTMEFLEFKTASEWGFKEFMEQGPTDYKKQAHALMLTGFAKLHKITNVKFIYLKKNTGHMWAADCAFDQAVADQVLEEYRGVHMGVYNKPIFALKEETYYKKPTGFMTAVYPCSYCPYLENCHGEPIMEFKKDQYGSQGPVFKYKKG